jgi:hypothetical protein
MMMMMMLKIVNHHAEGHPDEGRNAEICHGRELERGKLERGKLSVIGWGMGRLILFAYGFSDLEVWIVIAGRIGPAFPAKVEFVVMLFAAAWTLPHDGFAQKYFMNNKPLGLDDRQRFDFDFQARDGQFRGADGC